MAFDLSEFDAEQRRAYQLWSIIQELLQQVKDKAGQQNIYYFFKEPEEATRLGLPTNKHDQSQLLKALSDKGLIKLFKKVDYKKTPQGTTLSAQPIVDAGPMELRAEAAALREVFEPTVVTEAQAKEDMIPLRLVKNGRELKLIASDSEVALATLTPELVPDKLFTLLMAKPGAKIDGFDLEKASIKTGNVSEVIRKVGLFSKASLRNLVFDVCTKHEVQLKPAIEASKAEWDSILEHKSTGKSSENNQLAS